MYKFFTDFIVVCKSVEGSSYKGITHMGTVTGLFFEQNYEVPFLRCGSCLAPSVRRGRSMLVGYL